MIESFKKLFVALESARVVHDHRFAHCERQQKHCYHCRYRTEPAEPDIVCVCLVAGCEATAGVRRKQNRTDGECKGERALRCDVLCRMFFLSFFASPFVSEIFRQAKSPFVSYACHIRDERVNLPRYHSYSFLRGMHLGDTDISLLFNGSVPSAPIFRKAFQRSRSTVSSSLNLLDASQLPALL